MELISMTNFVLEQFSKMMKSNQPALLQRELFTDPVFKYAQFLKHPLKLEMFVPCDEDGNDLEEPVKYKNSDERWGTSEITERWKNYQKAKEKVIFEDWKALQIDEKGISIFNKKNDKIYFFLNGEVFFENEKIETIEDLVTYRLNINIKF